MSSPLQLAGEVSGIVGHGHVRPACWSSLWDDLVMRWTSSLRIKRNDCANEPVLLGLIKVSPFSRNFSFLLSRDSKKLLRKKSASAWDSTKSLFPNFGTLYYRWESSPQSVRLAPMRQHYLPIMLTEMLTLTLHRWFVHDNPTQIRVQQCRQNTDILLHCVASQYTAIYWLIKRLLCYC